MNVFKTLNFIQTHLLTWGDPFDCNGSDVIVCITGNPGITDFYLEFGSELHERTGFPVCVIGQAGHEEVPDKASNILENNEHLFNLKGQLNHKLDLINNHIATNSKLHLIGHSIGAWLIVELLNENDLITKRVSSVNLLFPTIQRMAESRNGKFLNGIIRRIHLLIILLFTILSLLPQFISVFFVNLYLKYYSLPSHYKTRILKYINPLVIEKVLFLAYDEMDCVTELNKAGMAKIKHLTNVIYSKTDGWAPGHYMDDLRIFQPSLGLQEVNIGHAFVLKASERIAHMVATFIEVKSN